MPVMARHSLLYRILSSVSIVQFAILARHLFKCESF